MSFRAARRASQLARIFHVDPGYTQMIGPTSRQCSVWFRDRRGTRWMTNVSGSSAFDAARKALAFFADPFWRGPRPRPEDVLDVEPNGGQLVRVRVSRVTAA